MQHCCVPLPASDTQGIVQVSQCKAAAEGQLHVQVLRHDGIIYMVLEYGDIDLARLLDKRQRARAQHGCSELDGNFLRLYWQQMLQVGQYISWHIFDILEWTASSHAQGWMWQWQSDVTET